VAEHYFSHEPSAPSRPGTLHLRLSGLDLELATDSGVFSAGRVDAGTLALLKESPAPPQSGHLLDLGCGYGPIACSLATRSPGATVWAVDFNSRALGLTAANAARLGLSNLKTVSPDGVPGDLTFSGIWSNPPVRIGKGVLHELLEAWLARLSDGASAWLVVHKHLGGDSLATWLTGCGWAVRRAASKSGYRVLEVSRP
jgi:16S rRNA (guanine1207-N2)-methyltransferase